MNRSKYSWPGYILPSQTKRLLNSSCDPNLTSNLTSKTCNVKPYPYIPFPTSSLNGSCNRSLRLRLIAVISVVYFHPLFYV